MKYKENTSNDVVDIQQTVEESKTEQINNNTISDLLDLLALVTEQQHSHAFCDKTIATLTKIRKPIINIMYLYDVDFTYPEIKAVKQADLSLDEIINMLNEVAIKINDVISKVAERRQDCHVEWYVYEVLVKALYELNDEILCLKHKNDK